MKDFIKVIIEEGVEFKHIKRHFTQLNEIKIQKILFTEPLNAKVISNTVLESNLN